MSIQEFKEGEVMECPHCEEEFADFDEYFEHITTCEKHEPDDLYSRVGMDVNGEYH